MAVSCRENGVPVHDDRAIFFLYGEEFVPGALGQRFRRLVIRVTVLILWRKRERGYYRESNRSGGLEGGMTTGCPLVVRGAGAGGEVTAAGVLADILRLAQNMRGRR